MGYKLSINDFEKVFQALKEKYVIYAPSLIKGGGNFSSTDRVSYSEIKNIGDIEFNKKSNFSAKEVLLPIVQTLFYFTEDNYNIPKENDKEILIFLRSCDIHALRRTDDIYLRNGLIDPYYKAIRDKIKIVLLGCDKSFENCFCVSMNTNKSNDYDLYINLKGNLAYVDIKNPVFSSYFSASKAEPISPNHVTENVVKVTLPSNLNMSKVTSKFWDSYDSRCIACGKCNFVCPTCTCFSMQDIHYKDNSKSGERKRVWSSCQVDGYTNMAGGHSFRRKSSERMRFKVMHKIYDHKARFGYNMCIGCGRCDDACPQYISFSNCINSLGGENNE